MEQLTLFIFGCVVFFITITGVLLYGMYTLREIAERENPGNYATSGNQGGTYSNRGSVIPSDETEV